MQSKRKVVITDYEYPDVAVERQVVESGGARLVAGQCRSEADLIALTRDADAVINQYALLTPAVIDAMDRCRAIIRYGIGLDTIDIPAATRAGIMVCNVPTYGIHEVSDHTIAMFLAGIRKLIPMDRRVKNGTWDCNRARPINRIHGTTFGLVGFGNIPRMVAAKLKPWSMRLIACDPYVNPDRMTRLGVTPVPFEQLLAESDTISCHVPLTDETRHLFDYDRFRRMKPNAYFINTSRGPVVDEAGLQRALADGHLAGAALDVMENEPPAALHPLYECDNVIITPHMAWYSEAAGKDLQRMAAEEAIRVLNTGSPLSCINLAELG
jgi:D-3-phosphoglycerate dehydrogenase